MKKPLSRVALILLVAIFMSALAFAQSDDKDVDAARAATQKLFSVFKARDWHALFDLIQFAPKLQQQMNDRNQFAKAFEEGLSGDSDFSKIIDSMDNVAVGAALIEGKFAYVGTTCTVKVDDQQVRFVGLAKLVKVDTAWRWDLTFTEDPAKASETRFEQLLGEPEKS